MCGAGLRCYMWLLLLRDNTQILVHLNAPFRSPQLVNHSLDPNSLDILLILANGLALSVGWRRCSSVAKLSHILQMYEVLGFLTVGE